LLPSPRPIREPSHYDAEATHLRQMVLEIREFKVRVQIESWKFDFLLLHRPSTFRTGPDNHLDCHQPECSVHKSSNPGAASDFCDSERLSDGSGVYLASRLHIANRMTVSCATDDFSGRRPPMAAPGLSSPQNLLYPEWQGEYQTALLELDQQTLLARVAAAKPRF
jgi:hypothetical protein